MVHKHMANSRAIMNDLAVLCGNVHVCNSNRNTRTLDSWKVCKFPGSLFYSLPGLTYMSVLCKYSPGCKEM